MSIYDELGVRTLINASANITRIGGSLMPSEVTEAMVETGGTEAMVDCLPGQTTWLR